MQNDLDYRRTKDGILKQILSETCHEMQTKAETTVKEKEQGSPEGSKNEEQ